MKIKGYIDGTLNDKWVVKLENPIDRASYYLDKNCDIDPLADIWNRENVEFKTRREAIQVLKKKYKIIKINKRDNDLSNHEIIEVEIK